MNDNYTEVDLKKIIKNLNKKLNSIEKIRKYIILDEELTYEKGFMTQTMKIKRKKVFEYFKDQINALY
jgi:long-chain acyl-CoA synthetase